MPRPPREIGRRVGVAGTFLAVGPLAAALTYPLVIGIDHLFWPDDMARFTFAGMLVAGTVLTILPSLVAGVAGAITSPVWKRRAGWLIQAAAIAAAMTMLEGVLFILLSGLSAAALFPTTDATLRILMLIAMLGLAGAIAGLTGATATQAWRPKRLSGLDADTFD